MEYSGAALETQALLAGYLRYRTVGRNIAIEDREMTIRLDRIIEVANDILALRIVTDTGEVFGRAFSR